MSVSVGRVGMSTRGPRRSPVGKSEGMAPEYYLRAWEVLRRGELDLMGVGVGERERDGTERERRR